jgi:hypothetical protein
MNSHDLLRNYQQWNSHHANSEHFIWWRTTVALRALQKRSLSPLRA